MKAENDQEKADSHAKKLGVKSSKIKMPRVLNKKDMRAITDCYVITEPNSGFKVIFRIPS